MGPDLGRGYRGKTCLELGYEPWHAAMHDREIEQVVATRQPVKGEVPFTGTFGRRIYEYIFVPVLGENGEVEAVAGTTRDVTDRRQTEEQVRHSERFHRAIAELSTDYAFDGTISPEGIVCIERVTEGFAKFYGLTLEEMNAQGGWGSVIHADDHPVVGKTSNGCWRARSTVVRSVDFAVMARSSGRST
ncbi:MAG TPA: PAS domain-containing protein [Gemmata sp.]|nr:PAS domain-containing protein [Gemmata sp.]